MANVFITGDFNTPVQLNEEKESKMISIKKKFGEIPFVIEDDKIYLFSASRFQTNTRDQYKLPLPNWWGKTFNSEISFIFQFFEGIGGYHLGVPSSDIVSKNLLKELYELFEEIQLDVSMTGSSDGQRTSINVRVNSKGEFICETEAPLWFCVECDEENEDDLSSCWSCETERVYDE